MSTRTERIPVPPTQGPVPKAVGTKAHLMGADGQPLCDARSYRGKAWTLALTASTTTCKHCRRTFGLDDER